MSIAACLSTGKDDWQTPDALFNALDEEFGFVLDGAANAENTKCVDWLGPGGMAEDALTFGWPTCGEAVWVNPPYSRGLQGKFIAKAVDAAQAGAKVVMLLPARTDTRAFHSYIWNQYEHKPWPGVEVRFLKGRLRFVGAPASAPFPSMVVIFGR